MNTIILSFAIYFYIFSLSNHFACWFDRDGKRTRFCPTVGPNSSVRTDIRTDALENPDLRTRPNWPNLRCLIFRTDRTQKIWIFYGHFCSDSLSLWFDTANVNLQYQPNEGLTKKRKYLIIKKAILFVHYPSIFYASL